LTLRDPVDLTGSKTTQTTNKNIIRFFFFQDDMFFFFNIEMKRYLINSSFAAELAKLATQIIDSTEVKDFVFF
jgi:hypothetical protein